MLDLQREILEFRRQIYRPSPRQTVVEWSESNLTLTQRQTEHPGPFSTAVRPYCREPLECWKDPSVSEVTLCWGSQTSKTTTLMAGLAWAIDTEPSPALWLMPSENLARSFSKSRWMPLLEDCPALVARFPSDADQMTNLEQQFDRCTLTFVGSNSPANLASRPVRILVADEVDKFAEATAKEADALDLAELAYAYSVAGRRSEAQQLLVELEERARNEYVMPTAFGVVHMALGNEERAFDWLERAAAARDLWLTESIFYPLYNPLRSHPRYANLLRALRVL